MLGLEEECGLSMTLTGHIHIALSIGLVLGDQERSRDNS